MNGKVIVAIGLVVAALVGGYLALKNAHSRPSITATLRITVTPKEQLDFVAGQANSAMFKYVIGKEAGIPPALARRVQVKTLPESAMLEAKVGVMTRDEGERFSKAFLDALQGLCGKQAQLTLAEQSVR